MHSALTFPAYLPLIVALAIRRADQRIRRDLLDAGTVSPAAAIQLSYSRPLRRRRLRRLSDAGAVVGVPPDRYYLNAARWDSYRRGRRRRGLIAASVVFALGGIAFVVVSLLR